MVRSGQGRLSGSVPSGGLCTDLPQWIQAPARLGSPCLQPPLSFYLPGGPEPWGHPTPLSTHQRDSLTNPRHLWVEGLVPLLEIPSLKPARICTSWSRGRCRSGLGSASAARRTFCERFAGPSVGGGTRVAAGDPVPVARSDLFLMVSRPLQGCPLFPVPAPSPQREGPPREVCRSLRNRNLPRSNIPWPLGAEFTVEPRNLLTSFFLELQNLKPATVYEVSSRCQLQNNRGFWSDWSATLKFQSLLAGGQVDMWVFGSPCNGPHPQEEPYELQWKDFMPGLGLTYKVVFQVPGRDMQTKVIPCCNFTLSKGTEWVSIMAVNITDQGHPSNLTLACSGSAPKRVQVNSMENQGMLVTWVPEPQEHQEFIVEWTEEKLSPQEISWTRLPNENHSTLLRGNFKKGVPYRVTVSSISLKGLAFASPVWGYSQEIAPPTGPALWQIPNDASGAVTVAWAELPRGQRGGHFTHYTLYVQADSGPPTLLNVSAETLNVTLWDLPGGHYKMWVIASTSAGPGQPGQILQLFLPEKNSKEWKVLWNVLLFCVLLSMTCCLGLVSFKCCLCQKFLPHWVSEKIPDPSNSKSMQPWGEEVPQAPPPKDALFLDVEEVETPMSPAPQLPEAPIPLDSGYEKHFLPTPEELGLLTLPRPQTST
ncbi:interleukin-27 receptor subunit alpha isoform X2 [Notamacropus eugenii]|uniref:interleukin-27 receptor subunit alpha isoform X2 n=1 Tax=Notamacropus eugenii TaxID=9315 RepID=UPI003B675C71